MNIQELGIWPGQLEVRADGDRPIITGRFPLGVTATISNRGRVRKERFAPGSMSWQVREFEKVQRELANVVKESLDDAAKARRVAELEDALEKRNTHLLVGHDFNRAIADMRSETLTIRETAEAMEFEALLPIEGQQPTWVRDAVLAVRGGQLRAVSPGFQVTTRGAERFVPESGPGNALVREILDSVVYEYSMVARPSLSLNHPGRPRRRSRRTESPEAILLVAVTLTVETLAAELGIPDDEITTRGERLLAVATETVERYAPVAPETVQNEAVIRFAGYL